MKKEHEDPLVLLIIILTLLINVGGLLLIFAPELQKMTKRMGKTVVMKEIRLRKAEPIPPGTPSQKELAAAKDLYLAKCAQCHGENGNGAGVAASTLNPPPTDFTSGVYKIRSTPTGEHPTDQDLFGSITLGLPGTGMPSWETLSTRERWLLVHYIKNFSPRFQERGKPPVPFEAPPLRTPERVSSGEKLYSSAKCWECHGRRGRGDGPSFPFLKDERGNPIRATDLTKSWHYKGGASIEEIYRTFSTGMDGTPMPSYVDSLNDEQRWDLALYTNSLIEYPLPAMVPQLIVARKSVGVRKILVARKVESGYIPLDPENPWWLEVEEAVVPLVGQVFVPPMLYAPAVDSLSVRVAYTDQEIGFFLTWNDPVRNMREGGGKTEDAVTLSVPLKMEPGSKERPYFGMGDKAHPVALWHWTAGAQMIHQHMSRGFTDIKPLEGPDVDSQALYRDGQWTVVIRSQLKREDGPSFPFQTYIPVAFAVFEGSNGEKGGMKGISTWQTLFLEPPVGNRPYLLASLAALGASVLEWGIWWLWIRLRHYR